MTDDGEDHAGDDGSSIPQDFSTRLAAGERSSRIDEYLDALAHRQRRLTLYYLHHSEQTTIESLAHWIAAVENDVPKGEVSADERERVAVELFHNHLSKLSDAKIIEYDSRNGDVRYRDPPKTVSDLIRVCSSVEVDE